MKKYGFTLAEVLITLAIIGVVAALAIPSVIQKYQYHSYYVGLKKAYNILSNVTNSLFFEYGNPKTTGWGERTRWTNFVDNNQKEIADYYFKHMNVICDGRELNKSKTSYPTASTIKCINHDSEIKTLNNLVGVSSNIPIGTVYGWSTYPFATQDKISYGIYFGDWDVVGANKKWGVSRHPKYSTNYYFIYVDVNGKNKPNKLGRDTFVFVVTDIGLLPLGLEHGGAQNYDCNNATETGFACAGRVIKEGGIKY